MKKDTNVSWLMMDIDGDKITQKKLSLTTIRLIISKISFEKDVFFWKKLTIIKWCFRFSVYFHLHLVYRFYSHFRFTRSLIRMAIWPLQSWHSPPPSTTAVNIYPVERNRPWFPNLEWKMAGNWIFIVSPISFSPIHNH